MTKDGIISKLLFFILTVFKAESQANTMKRNNVISTIIGKEAEFKGTMTSLESIRIEGKFEGKISTQGNVFVGKSGIVQANIDASNIVIAGEVKGNVDAKERMEVGPTGKVYGDIRVQYLSSADGAVIYGKSEIGKNEKQD